MKTADIQIRDPFILPVPATEEYFLFGTTDTNAWNGPAQGFDCYRSHDLENWEGPIPAFRPPTGFWSNTNFWAPEVHCFNGRYYMFASFKAPRRYRGTQILAADVPQGPYLPISDGPVTPPDWECLDGTLHVGYQGVPWLVFCHEWVQIHNGAIYAMPLTADLTQPAGKPVLLFNASEAPWVKRRTWPENNGEYRFPTYVTDGPFLFRTRNKSLLMLWSSVGEHGYAMGIARSGSGYITGPWTQDAEPIWSKDGGHGMIFRTFDERLMLTLHHPNRTPEERALFRELADTGSGIKLI